MNDDFGRSITTAGFALAGPIDRDHAESIPAAIDLSRKIVASIGMHCSHPPQITDYEKNADGVSPGFIITQPIYESAVLLDVWPPLQAMYVHVISCKTFMPEPLWDLFREHGFSIQDVTGGVLSL